jgi:hypothetical protein
MHFRQSQRKCGSVFQKNRRPHQALLLTQEHQPQLAQEDKEKKYRSYPASILEEHAQRRQEDGDQDLAESRSGASLPHCEKISLSKEMQTTLTLNVENSQIKALQKT